MPSLERRTGKYGEYYGCTNYPICKNIPKIEKTF
ncbi:topoisomerase DNA-binding C4 zinc finger domain-containing protein [Lutibacter sp. B2]|nr:topoisomerase DNA-binding C4 zinc finger domain-containing protein [Lutibacter sp. B2]